MHCHVAEAEAPCERVQMRKQLLPEASLRSVKYGGVVESPYDVVLKSLRYQS